MKVYDFGYDALNFIIDEIQRQYFAALLKIMDDLGLFRRNLLRRFKVVGKGDGLWP
jgi:hypothetical protein